jgi:hypothetical protein
VAIARTIAITLARARKGICEAEAGGRGRACIGENAVLGWGSVVRPLPRVVSIARPASATASLPWRMTTRLSNAASAVVHVDDGNTAWVRADLLSPDECEKQAPHLSAC